MSSAWRVVFGCAAVVVLSSTCQEIACSCPPLPLNEWQATLGGANEVPPVTSTATASGTFTLIPRGAIGSDTLVYQIILVTAFPGADSIIEAHIHSPAAPGANAAVAVWLCGSSVGGPTGTPPTLPTGPAGTPTCPTGLGSGQAISGRASISSAVLNSIRAFSAYANVHTKSNAGGEIRGQLRFIN